MGLARKVLARLSVRPLVEHFLSRSTARWARLLVLSIATGALSGAAATLLYLGLHYGTRMGIARFVDASSSTVMTFRWGTILLPACGGLVSGLLLWALARKEFRGHGTNQYIEAFHFRRGMLPLREPAVIATSAIGVISCGGSAGPEGPTAALGAAIGSTVARTLKVSPTVIRQMLVAGCSAGVGAVFQCPLGGALFGTSVLYRDPEFESASMVPSVVASVISYATFTALAESGHQILVGVEQLEFSSPWELLPYLLLGLLCGLTVMVYRTCITLVERARERQRLIPPWLVPGLGCLLAGVVGCFLPQVMDGEYLFIQRAVNGVAQSFPEFSGTPGRWAALLAVIAFAKCAATALTVGSGAAGGTLGPAVFIGGCVGAGVGAALDALFPGAVPENLRRSLIAAGMAGVLSGSMRTPLAAIVMVTEMTGSYGLIVPLMLVSVTSYVVGRRWGLNTAQVRSSAQSPAHAGDVLLHLLESIRARDLASLSWPYTVSPTMSLGELTALAPLTESPVFLVQEQGRLAGLIHLSHTGSDMAQALTDPAFSRLVIAADIMQSRPPVIDGEDHLYDALEQFRRTELDVLPVVTGGRSRRVLGMLSRRAIHEAVSAQLKSLNAQVRAEHGHVALLEQDEQLHQLASGVIGQDAPRIRRLKVPPSAIGRSLRETNFRRTYGVEVVGIQDPDGTLHCPPDLDAPLLQAQLLLVLGYSNPSTATPTADQAGPTDGTAPA